MAEGDPGALRETEQERLAAFADTQGFPEALEAFFGRYAPVFTGR